MIYSRWMQSHSLVKIQRRYW